MDFFGIGAAMKSMAAVYIRSSRGTGRTTTMLNSLQNGDIVVFADTRETERVRKLIRRMHLDVKCITVSPDHPNRLFERPPCNGRVFFDHSWVENWYLNAMHSAEKDLQNLENAATFDSQKNSYDSRTATYETRKWSEI